MKRTPQTRPLVSRRTVYCGGKLPRCPREERLAAGGKSLVGFIGKFTVGFGMQARTVWELARDSELLEAVGLVRNQG